MKERVKEAMTSRQPRRGRLMIPWPLRPCSSKVAVFFILFRQIPRSLLQIASF
jgi:hypothetical protein